jgi:hypothetical protein
MVSPKEIAQASLDTITTISNNVKSIAAAFLAPAAGSRAVSSVSEVLRGTAQSAAEITIEKRPPEETRKKIDEQTKGILGSVTDLSSSLVAITRLTTNTFSSLGNDITNAYTDLRNTLGQFPSRPEMRREIMSDNQFTQLKSAITEAFKDSIPATTNPLSPATAGGAFPISTTQNINLKEIKIILPSGEEKTLSDDTINKMTRSELIALIREVSRKDVKVEPEGNFGSVPSRLR